MSALRSGMRCTECGGYTAPHARAGATRGSCHCWRGPGRVSGIRFDDGPGGNRARYEFLVYYPGWDDLVETYHDFVTAFRALNALRTAANQAAGQSAWPTIPMPIEAFNARYDNII